MKIVVCKPNICRFEYSRSSFLLVPIFITIIIPTFHQDFLPSVSIISPWNHFLFSLPTSLTYPTHIPVTVVTAHIPLQYNVPQLHLPTTLPHISFSADTPATIHHFHLSNSPFSFRNLYFFFSRVNCSKYSKVVSRYRVMKSHIAGLD